MWIGTEKRNDCPRKWIIACSFGAASLMLGGCRNPTTIRLGSVEITASPDTFVLAAVIILLVLLGVIGAVLFYAVKRLWLGR